MFRRGRSNGTSQDSLQSDLAAFRMDPAVLPAHLQDAAEETGAGFDVWPEHEDVVSLFLRAGTQWRFARDSVLGLDYGALPFLTTLMNIEPTLELLDDLQTMESHAVELLNKPQKKAKKRRKG